MSRAIRMGLVICSVAAVAALLLVAPVTIAAQEVGLPLGTIAPPAALQDLDGNAVNLADYIQGRPALIEFLTKLKQVQMDYQMIQSTN